MKRITMLPEGLTNYQHRQWNENFHELSRKMLHFGFTDDVIFNYMIKVNINHYLTIILYKIQRT